MELRQVSTLAFIYKEDYVARLRGRKWDYGIDFAMDQKIFEDYLQVCKEFRAQFICMHDLPLEFQEEEIREAFRIIRYKRETNKNYASGFIDRTPTIIHYEDF